MDFHLFPEAYIKPLIVSALGGLVLNIMNLYQDYQQPKSQQLSKDIIYWSLFLFWPFISCLLSYVYLDSGNKISSLLAFHIGLSSPVLLQSLIATSPAMATSTQHIEQ